MLKARSNIKKESLMLFIFPPFTSKEDYIDFFQKYHFLKTLSITIPLGMAKIPLAL